MKKKENGRKPAAEKKAALPALDIPEEFAPALLGWYSKSARVLPWRDDPQPYKVWVSEIMLQQTRVEAVKPYFQRFIDTLPDLEALASADEETLLKLWEGLGYYNRVRNLQKAAQQAVKEYGGLPSSAEELIKLPGIGPYTAGAVASIAFGQPVPAVDGNVLRVVTRLLAYDADIMKESVKKQVSQALIPSVQQDPSAFNQAVMELGAMVCLPNGAPKCGECPAAFLCEAHRCGTELSYPVKKSKKARKIQQKTIFLLEYDGRTAVCRRPDSGLLAGLWAFPETDDYLEEEEVPGFFEELGLAISGFEPLGPAKHIFSHIEWHMTGYRAALQEMPEESAAAFDNLLPGASERSAKTNSARDDGDPELSDSSSETDSRSLVFLTADEIRSRCALPSAYGAYSGKIR